MSIFVFSLLVGYTTSGVDYALGVRSAFLRKADEHVKYILTEPPTEYYVYRYRDMGIDIKEMLSMQLFLADNYDLSGKCKISEKINEIRQHMKADKVIENSDTIDLYKDGNRIASIMLKGNREFLTAINYYDRERLLYTEHYADKLLYIDVYATCEENGKKFAKRVKTKFMNKKGVMVYECLYNIDGEELYVYPNGKSYTKYQLLEQFVKEMNFTESDIVLIDRPSYSEFVQPLFQYGSKAKIITFLHSDQYFEKGEDPAALYLNSEYYYWFKYSNKIDLMLVSTEEQKKRLKQKLMEYNCYVPRIEAILTSGLDNVKRPKRNRKKYSLLTVSRLDARKKLEWVIASVIEAHKRIPEISLDIYGGGDYRYAHIIKKMVEEHKAEEYIRFMGHCDMENIYMDYELYVTASLWETLGLSVMEAIGSGNAVVGLDVRYGNRLFVENGKNGRLIAYNHKDLYNQEKTKGVIMEMANAIVEILEDESRLREYQEHSYKIAEGFLNEKIESKWIELIDSINNKVE